MTQRTTIADILETMVGLSAHPSNHDEGVQMCEADREFRKTLVCWMASWDAFLDAERVDVEFVMGHESLFHKTHLTKNNVQVPQFGTTA